MQALTGPGLMVGGDSNAGAVPPSRHVYGKDQTPSDQLSSVQSLSRVRLFATPWTAACQASLSITNSWSLPKLMSIELVMPYRPQGPGESLLLQEVFLPEMIFSLPRSLLELTALSHPWLDTKVVPKKCVQTYPQTPSGSRNVRQSWEGEGLLPQEVSLRYQQQGEQGPPPRGRRGQCAQMPPALDSAGSPVPPTRPCLWGTRGWLMNLPSKGTALRAWGGICPGVEDTAPLMRPFLPRTVGCAGR